MSNTNRFASPKAELVESGTPLDAKQFAQADKLVKTARLSFVVLFGAFLIQIFAFPKRPDLSSLFLLVYLACFVVAHIYLGRAASRIRRSWVLYGAVPLLMPILGGLISFGFLRHFIPEPGDA